MHIRTLEYSDFEQIKAIHEKFYREEFSMDDFCKGFMYAVVVLEGEEIITAGGVRAIAESVIITNKDVSVKLRREALYKILEVNRYICQQKHFDQLHAFIHDDTWKEQLERVGFQPCKGKAIYLPV